MSKSLAVTEHQKSPTGLHGKQETGYHFLLERAQHPQKLHDLIEDFPFAPQSGFGMKLHCYASSCPPQQPRSWTERKQGVPTPRKCV